MRALLLALVVVASDPSVFVSQTNYKKVEKKSVEVRITLTAKPGWKFNSEYPLWLHGYKNKIHADNRLPGEVTYTTLPANSGTEFTFRAPLKEFSLTNDKLFVKISFSFCNETTCRVWRGEVFKFAKKDLK